MSLFVSWHAVMLVETENSWFAALLKNDTKINGLRNGYDLFSTVPHCIDYLGDALGV